MYTILKSWGRCALWQSNTLIKSPTDLGRAVDFLLTAGARFWRSSDFYIVRRGFENAICSEIAERKRVFRPLIFRGEV